MRDLAVVGVTATTVASVLCLQAMVIVIGADLLRTPGWKVSWATWRARVDVARVVRVLPLLAVAEAVGCYVAWLSLHAVHGARGAVLAGLLPAYVLPASLGLAWCAVRWGARWSLPIGLAYGFATAFVVIRGLAGLATLGYL